MTAVYLAIIGFAFVSMAFGVFVLRNPNTPIGSRLATKGSFFLMAGTLINIAPNLFPPSTAFRIACIIVSFVCIVVGLIFIKRSFRATAELRAKTLADADALRQGHARETRPFDSQ
jgi:hypothetical protein